MKKYILFYYSESDDNWLVHCSYDSLDSAVRAIKFLTSGSLQFKIATIYLSECLTCTFQDNKLFIV